MSYLLDPDHAPGYVHAGPRPQRRYLAADNRKHVYTLQYGDGSRETVRAKSPTEAVALRHGGPRQALPHTITDETLMGRWLAR